MLGMWAVYLLVPVLFIVIIAVAFLYVVIKNRNTKAYLERDIHYNWYYPKDAVIEFHFPQPENISLDLPVKIYGIGCKARDVRMKGEESFLNLNKYPICEGKLGDTLAFPLMSGYLEVNYKQALRANVNPNFNCIQVLDFVVRVEIGEAVRILPVFDCQDKTRLRNSYEVRYSVSEKQVKNGQFGNGFIGGISIAKGGSQLPQVPIELRPRYAGSTWGGSNESLVSYAKNAGQTPNQKSAAGAMVKGAVVGGIVGGQAGAVVGAMVGKEQHEHKKKQQ